MTSRRSSSIFARTRSKREIEEDDMRETIEKLQKAVAELKDTCGREEEVSSDVCVDSAGEIRDDGEEWSVEGKGNKCAIQNPKDT